MTRRRWEILAASAAGVSALALAIADPFRVSSAPPLEGPPPIVHTPIDAPTQGPSQAPVQRPRIEVVFAVDTTGSMGGLIDGAKRKVWSIANALASGQPRPDLRIGLIAYRDIGDAYVVRATALSDDLDEVESALRQFSADGGGDGPEHVNAALAHAVRQTQWSSDEGVLKLVFLVGDAPPHDDYDDGLTAEALAHEAHDKGIIINTIRCGSDAATQVAWQRIAAASGGEFASIAQDGGVTTVVTPFDDELRALNAELADTVLGYGSAADKAKSRAKMRHRKAMASPAAASAASFSAKAGRLNREDLVSALDEGLELEEVEEEALPEELQGLDRGEQRRVVEAKKAKREATRQRILEVAKKRDAYLDHAAPEGSKDAFDARVLEMTEKQTAKIGVKY